MSQKTPSISVVIPTYRRHKELCQCLDCLGHYFEPGFQQQLGFLIEVIVTDDARDIELRSLLQDLYPWCRFTAGPGRGPAANRNHGAKLASGEWLLFTDDDCLPQEGWIENFREFTSAFDVLIGQVLPYGIKQAFDEECPINTSGAHLWSCNFAIHNKHFIALGGFNECFPYPAMEDCEIFQRILKYDLRFCYIESAIILHPWRKIPGVQSIVKHAKSEAYYVDLVGCHQNYLACLQVERFVRDIARKLKRSREERLFKGLLRSMFLSLVHALFVFYYTKIASKRDAW